MKRLVLTMALVAASPAFATGFDTSAGPVTVERVAGGLASPWSLAFLPDGRMLVTEKTGALRYLDGDTVSAPIAGVPEVWASGQGGLLDVALDPDFAETGRLYLSYAEPVGRDEARTALARARLAGDRLTDVETIFRQEPPMPGGRHFGGRIVVAPDGSLFLGLGDRGEPEMAQDLSTHVGKLVRILPDGRPHPDNPFAQGGDGLPEIFSWGHRNIQGAALDADGRLWTQEHGARGGDEINRPEAGKNYGWPVISYGRHYSGAKIGEGTEKPGMEQPVFYWDPSIAPSGLTVYSGALWPEWEGHLFSGALRGQLVNRLDLGAGAEERLFERAFGRIRDVREGPDGALWFLTDARPGALYRVAPAD
jgi:glucose/arabinose dehydrogenase